MATVNNMYQPKYKNVILFVAYFKFLMEKDIFL